MTTKRRAPIKTENKPSKRSKSSKNSKNSKPPPTIKQEIKSEPKPITCPICQNDIDQYTSIATPNTCTAHIFCVDCLLTWTKKSGVCCPICRQNYKEVNIYESNYYKNLWQEQAVPSKVLIVDKTGKKKDKPKVGTFYIHSQGYVSEEEDDISNLVNLDQDSNSTSLSAAQSREIENMLWMNVFCQICHDNDNEENLLLCDGCDDAFHTYCLSPALDNIPEDDWFCENCHAEDIAEVRGEVSRNRRENYGRTRSQTSSGMGTSVGRISSSRDESFQSQDVVIESMIDQVLTQISLTRPGRPEPDPTHIPRARSTARGRGRGPTRGRGRPRGRRRRRQRKRRKKEPSSGPSTSKKEENFSSSSKTPSKPDLPGLDHFGSGPITFTTDEVMTTPDAPKPYLSDQLKNQKLDRKFVCLPCPFKTSKSRVEDLKLEARRRNLEKQQQLKGKGKEFSLEDILKGQEDMMKMGKKSGVKKIEKPRSIFSNIRGTSGRSIFDGGRGGFL